MRSWALIVVFLCGGCPATDGDDTGDDDGPSGDWTEVTQTAQFGLRAGMGAVVHDGAMWIAGGNDNVGFPETDVWRSLDGASWSNATTSAAFGMRNGARMLSYAGQLWLLGGIVPGTPSAGDVWSSSDGVTWTLQGTIGSGRGGGSVSIQAAVVYGGAMWAFTLEDAGIHRSTDGVTWQPMAMNVEALTGRGNFAVVEHDGRLVMAGGTSGSGYASDVWSSADGITWALLTRAPAWGWKVGQSLVVAGGRMWFVGGSTYGAVWTSTDGVTWTLREEDAPWAHRSAHGVLVHDGAFWVVAGNNGTMFGALADVWSLDVAP